MFIQYLLVFLVVLILCRVLIKWRQGFLAFRDMIFWVGFWLVVGAIVIVPETTSFMARMVGVGRGADLVVYLSIVLIFYIIFQITVKIERVERNITKIVRQVALSGKGENASESGEESIPAENKKI
jgi:hypothetical protein